MAEFVWGRFKDLSRGERDSTLLEARPAAEAEAKTAGPEAEARQSQTPARSFAAFPQAIFLPLNPLSYTLSSYSLNFIRYLIYFLYLIYFRFYWVKKFFKLWKMQPITSKLVHTPRTIFQNFVLAKIIFAKYLTRLLKKKYFKNLQIWNPALITENWKEKIIDKMTAKNFFDHFYPTLSRIVWTDDKR